LGTVPPIVAIFPDVYSVHRGTAFTPVVGYGAIVAIVEEDVVQRVVGAIIVVDDDAADLMRNINAISRVVQARVIRKHVRVVKIQRVDAVTLVVGAITLAHIGIICIIQINAINAVVGAVATKEGNTICFSVIINANPVSRVVVKSAIFEGKVLAVITTNIESIPAIATTRDIRAREIIAFVQMQPTVVTTAVVVGKHAVIRVV
jgi:hypothetical protein